MRRGEILKSIDWQAIGIYFLLLIIGWLNIYAASYSLNNTFIFNFSAPQGKQFIWILLCILMGVVILLLDSHFFQTFSRFFYGGTILLLILVLIIGDTVHGATAWFDLGGGIKVQPSEFGKFATALMLAWLIGKKKFSFKRKKWWVAVFGVIFLPAVLILLENDTGSALIYVAFVLALFRFDLPMWLFVAAVVAIVLFIAAILLPNVYLYIAIGLIGVIYFLLRRKSVRHFRNTILITAAMGGFCMIVKPVFNNVLLDHQKTRILVMLGQKNDLRGVEWNVYQSKIAIGSGGFFGRGYLQGPQTQMNFVPKQNTDFIFSAVAEEWGFLGATFVVLLFVVLILRIISRAEKQRNLFALVYGYCTACVLFVHVTINIGMAIGIMPTIGIPLPFISYGGSSLVGFSLLFWVFIKLDSINMDVVLR